MKKTFILSMILVLLTSLFAFNAFAAEPSVTLSGSLISGSNIELPEGDVRGTEYEYTITVKNSNTEYNISDLEIVEDLTSVTDFTVEVVDVTESTLGSESGETSTEFKINVTVAEKLDYRNEEFDLGKVYIKYDAVNASDAADTVNNLEVEYNLVYIAESKLAFIEADFDVKVGDNSKEQTDYDSKTDDEALPYDQVEITFELENLFSSSSDIELENVEVELFAGELDSDGDDLEIDTSVDDIKDNGDEKGELSFIVPFDIIAGDYDIVITATAEDDNDAMHYADYIFTLEVDREKHDIIIKDTDLSKSTIRCDASRRLELDVEVLNMGTRDEDDVEIKVENSELDLYFKESELELESIENDDDDSKYNAEFIINVDEDAESGTYSLYVTTYIGNKKYDSTNVEFVVEECVEEEVIKTPVDNNDNIVVDLTPTDVVVETETSNDEATETTNVAPAGVSLYTVALIGAIIVLLNAIVLLVAFNGKKSRR